MENWDGKIIIEEQFDQMFNFHFLLLPPPPCIYKKSFDKISERIRI